MKFKGIMLMVVMSLVMVFAAACGNNSGNTENSGSTNSDGEVSGDVLMDGSSTVFPIMEAVAEEYASAQPDVKVSVGVSGSGGGFEKFAAGETDMSNASRPIKEEEVSALEEAGIEFTEFEIAKDGLSIVVNSENDWVDQLTIDELKMIWTGEATMWSDVNSEWPEEKIELFSPGTDSGTYDYFNEVVLEDEQMVKEATLSEDDNVLVNGVTGSKNGMAFFGYAYYLENKDSLNVIPIVNGDGEAIEPNAETIQDGSYEPLSRPLFTYVKHSAVTDNPAVYDFTKYALENAGDMAEAVGYVALPEEKYTEDMDKLNEIAGK
ncbi:PstS family phosphate ABC transporter substrate-binding protein [Alkalihalobacillus hwajinpoensis]|uniref:PstS family phosphate ABC transporter substrate-binding protein n=1 Tax=Guptibacillus hwajinpoensis TaxID=208199 RepID=UPI0018836432|nr:PstS family phosphate ABC transporter substrate-binding protein [Pseudalkalibacillus hwajinpoensis]MBF0709288.1 PstS family phosphate ABC transporter substrate-binding protein [Pseudalkalibacillus hwajinpoensis]